MAIFQFKVIITFKSNFIRTQIEVPCILSLSHPTKLSAIDSDGNVGSSQVFDHLFDYTKFEEYKNENMHNDQKKASFVQHIGQRLKRNILRMATSLRFVGFSMTMKDFKAMMKIILISIQALNALNVPESILNVIGFYVLFHESAPISDLLQNQRCIIRDCRDCDVFISSPKFNHLMVRSCHNMSISFPHIISQCELFECSNITIRCSNILHHYRFDACTNVKVEFADFCKRVTFLCFESENVQLIAHEINWRVGVNEEEEELDENEHLKTISYDVKSTKEQRLNVRWRSTANEPLFTQRKFHPNQTIGSNQTH